VHFPGGQALCPPTLSVTDALTWPVSALKARGVLYCFLVALEMHADGNTGPFTLWKTHLPLLCVYM